MASLLASAAADAVRSLNPRLPPLPPPEIEESGKDVCFVDPPVLCKDLPDGMRGVISSWYLSPERHVAEFVCVAILSVVSLCVLVPRLPTCARSSAGNDLRPPLLLRLLIGLCFSLQIVYKIAGYSGKLLMMLMPCNVLWILHFSVAFLPLSANTRHTLIQLFVTYLGLPIVAVATPDLSDVILPFEVEYFFLNHALLIVFPIYWVSSGKVSMLPSRKSGESVLQNFTKWYLFACTCFGFFYFTLVTPLAIYSGINLNWMTHPPENPGNIVSGDNFRIISIACCATLFFIMRFAALVAENLATAFMSRIRSEEKKKRV